MEVLWNGIPFLIRVAWFRGSTIRGLNSLGFSTEVMGSNGTPFKNTLISNKVSTNIHDNLAQFSKLCNHDANLEREHKP